MGDQRPSAFVGSGTELFTRLFVRLAYHAEDNLLGSKCA